MTAIDNFIEEQSFERFLLISISWLIIAIALYVVKKILNRNISDTNNKHKARKVTNIFGYIMFVSVLLLVYNDKFGNIGVVLGVAGAGIAFALQEVIVSIAGWLSIIFTGSLKTGNRVQLGGIKGDIIDIGVLKTTIMEVGEWINGDLYNGRIVTVANSFVFKEPVYNYSAEYPFLWDEITVPIRTESDFNLARTIFIKVLQEECGGYTENSKKLWAKLTNKYLVEKAQVEPMVTLSFDENWITFTLRYIVDYKKRRSTKDKIYTRLLEEINKQDHIVMIAASSLEITSYLDNREKK